ncbi:VIT1/CCC1 transporter family protein [Paraflavisolibacter sp. H34]|uniref:VIT1/CCC1 transporter family protein n=1 Tax=Huijunlia imazamoxiresistens TaxID=3127457 RepID=UPI003016A44A
MEMAIGLSDGLGVPFVLATGLSAVCHSPATICTIVLLQATAGAAAMAWAGYEAAKTGADTAPSTESQRSEEPVQKVRAFYARLGVPAEVQEQAVTEALKDREDWKHLLREEQVGQPAATPDPWKGALVIGAAYFAGGLVPLIPYFFRDQPLEALPYATALTLIFLFTLGWWRGKATGIAPLPGALRITLLTALAATAAFFVARLFV